MFDARLDSRTTRAVDIFDGVDVDGDAVTAIVRSGVALDRGEAATGACDQA